MGSQRVGHDWVNWTDLSHIGNVKDNDCIVFCFVLFLKIYPFFNAKLKCSEFKFVSLSQKIGGAGEVIIETLETEVLLLPKRTLCYLPQHPALAKQVMWLQAGQSGLRVSSCGNWFVLSGKPWDCRANRWILVTRAGSWIKPHLKPQYCSIMWVNIFLPCKTIKLGFDVFVSNFGRIPEINRFQQML